MSVLLLGGSPSTHSSGARLLQLIGERLALHGHHCSTLHVRDLPAHALLHADIGDQQVARALALVQQADAIVIATPVYKASFSGMLKAFLDLLPQDALKGKVLLPLATGATQSHMLVLDYALRPVLSSMSPRFILHGIYATSEQLPWSADDGLAPDPAIAARITRAVAQLSWELLALRPSCPTPRRAQSQCLPV